MKIPSQCRIGKTIITSIAVIEGKLYSNYPKNINHFHKHSKDLASVILTLGTNKTGGGMFLLTELK